MVATTLMTHPWSPARAEETGNQDQSSLAGEIIKLIRQEMRTEALPLCRDYNVRFPGDPAMLYNQACLENMTGSPEDAAATFARAVAAGFDDFDLAFADPDLEGLQDHPTVIQLAREHDEDLARASLAAAITLTWQEESLPIPLTAPGVQPTGFDPEIILTWTPNGLLLELNASGPWSDLVGNGQLAPWNGGPGLAVTLAIPESGIEARTSNHFLFAFGAEGSQPIGALFLAGQKRWQIITELQPKMKVDAADNLELTALIPWAAFLPYDPVVDDRLGFNAALRAAGIGQENLASLLPDPAAFRPRAPFRRFVPLIFETGSISGDVFAGKVSGTISGAEPVTIDLMAVSSAAGQGRLTIDFLGGPEQSLLPGGQASGGMDLELGLNRFSRQADFSSLDTGAYVIKAELDFPSGRTVSWGSTILQLAPGWRDQYAGRIAGLDSLEEPTASFLLASIEQAVAEHHPRRSPGPIVTTLNELGRLLDTADKEGSILPDKGNFLAVYTGPEGGTRLCHIYLPVGWKIAKNLNPVVIAPPAPGMAAPIADRIGQNYEQGRQKPTLKAGQDEGFPVYLVPTLAAVGSSRSDDPRSEITATANWARETFKSSLVSIAGADQGAATTLEFAVGRTEGIKAMIIFAGRDLEPWPLADSSFIKERLAGFPTDLPVTWNDFVTETRSHGQGVVILEVLQDLGANIVDEQEVRGGMNFTQVADRTVLWAEGLR